MVGANIRRGLIRGWVVFTFVWLLSMLAFVAWKTISEPVCYAFDSITLNEDYKGQNASFVKELRDRLLKTASFCSATTSIDLLTLESDARDKAISQVSLAWKEPAGWSTETQAMLDVLDGKEITASRITGDVTKFSYEARLRSKTLFLMTMAVMPFLIFGLGAGIYWTLVGFRKA